ncbi:MAG: hypothetical protein OCC45_02080 [Desulfotalea sp.]
MLNRLNIISIGILALLLSGCGHSLKENRPIVPTAPYNAVGQGKSVVVLPLVDYSDGAIDTSLRRNLLISEALMDNLSINGFNFPVQEDVFEYLVDENIVSTNSSESALTKELRDGDWSDAMRNVLKNEQNKKSTAGNKGLTTKELKKLGKNFQSDYILRGRIIEYKERQDTSFNPFKRGIVPFLVETGSRVSFGFADTDKYDGKTQFQVGSRATGMVELRLWVQDATTGDVIWTNHNNIEAAPCCFFSDPQHDKLYTTAIRETASRLIHDFALNGMN